MDDLNYTELSTEIDRQLKTHQYIILATCANNNVTARAMAHINDGVTVMFSTNRNSKKVEQMKQNPNIALAIEGIKIEAAAEIFGQPKSHSLFTAEYVKKFPQYGTMYLETPDDLLIIARPQKISLYKYLGKPWYEVLDVENNRAYRVEL